MKTDRNKKILIAGYKGMVGSAITRLLRKEGFKNLILVGREDIDLTNQRAVFEYIKSIKPDYVIVAAAKVGGINANNEFRAQFLYENLSISINIIHASHLADVENLVFLGSSCIYPKDSFQPIKEEYLLTGPLESTNEPYAIAKIAALKLCETYNHQFKRKYFTIMPTNLYGPNDNYDLKTSHVLPALLKKVFLAKKNNADFIEIWGTGKPLREFMHVDDLASAVLFLIIKHPKPDIYNVGSGEELSINDLAKKIINIAGLKLKIVYDEKMPDGVSRKRLDLSKIEKLGWKSKISLDEGIKRTLSEIESQN